MAEPQLTAVDAAPLPGSQQVAWLMDRSAESTMLTDLQGRIEYVNPAFVAMTGYARDEVLGRTPVLLKSGLQAPEVYERLWKALHAGQEFRGLLINRRKNGELFHEEKSIRPLFDARGSISHYLSCGRDVSERVAAMARLQRAATHDVLTGLPNRALFLERVAAAVARLRSGGKGFTIALVDVDDFKRVNDEHGHAAGDAVLQAVAQRLQQGVRKADTVARLGGDEFALLLEGSCDEADASAVLLGILDALERAIVHDGVDLHASLSIGACVDTTGDLGTNRLIELADAAMYRAKRDGGCAFRVGMADPVTASMPLAPVPLAALGEGTQPASAPRPAHDRSPWRRRVVRAGDALFRQGQRFTHVYVLRQGSVRMARPAAPDREPAASLRRVGDWLGLDGLATRRHRFDAFALADTELWVMGYDELLRAANRSPEVLAMLVEAMGREIARDGAASP